MCFILGVPSQLCGNSNMEVAISNVATWLDCGRSKEEPVGMHSCIGKTTIRSQYHRSPVLLLSPSTCRPKLQILGSAASSILCTT